jgi:hypothetical protein
VVLIPAGLPRDSLSTPMRTPAITEIDISIKKSISWTPRKASTILFLLNGVFINHKSIMISVSNDVRFEMQIVIIIYDLSFWCNLK